MSIQIYDRPDDYDLEHETDRDDVRFYCQLASTLKPRRLLELGCGSGRVTMALSGVAARGGFDVVGLDMADTMLAEAARKRAALSDDVRRRVTFVKGDMRSWQASVPFDLIVTPCSSITHLLTLDDQLAAWRRAHDNLAAGGRFVVDVATPDLIDCADAAASPPRAPVELDTDSLDPDTGERLMRYKVSRYLPQEQRSSTRFIYDKFTHDHWRERYVSDFEAHVYFPRELRLLFLCTGFEVEAIYGDYRFGPLRRTSTDTIVIGRRTG